MTKYRLLVGTQILVSKRGEIAKKRITTRECIYEEHELDKFFAGGPNGDSRLITIKLPSNQLNIELIHVMWQDLKPVSD